MPSFELTKSDIEKLGIAEAIKDQEVLRSLAEIACYLRCSITSVRRAIKNRGLPANPDFLGRYMTTKTLINQWVTQSHLETVESRNWDQKDNHPHRKATDL